MNNSRLFCFSSPLPLAHFASHSIVSFAPIILLRANLAHFASHSIVSFAPIILLRANLLTFNQCRLAEIERKHFENSSQILTPLLYRQGNEKKLKEICLKRINFMQFFTSEM